MALQLTTNEWNKQQPLDSLVSQHFGHFSIRKWSQRVVMHFELFDLCLVGSSRETMKSEGKKMTKSLSGQELFMFFFFFAGFDVQRNWFMDSKSIERKQIIWIWHRVFCYRFQATNNNLFYGRIFFSSFALLNVITEIDSQAFRFTHEIITEHFERVFFLSAVMATGVSDISEQKKNYLCSSIIIFCFFHSFKALNLI